jgi:hypothetical protein
MWGVRKPGFRTVKGEFSMTALVLDNIAALPILARKARGLLKRAGDAIDNTVSALAARKVPDWQMAQIRKDIDDQLRRLAGTRAGNRGFEF